MPTLTDNQSCCGLREIDDLSNGSTPKQQMLDLAEQIYGSSIYPENAAKEDPIWGKNASPKWLKGAWPGAAEYLYDSKGRVIYKTDWEFYKTRGGPKAYFGESSYGDASWRYAVFTQAGARRTYGKKFAAFILEHKLGEVVQATTKTVRNPNSGNVLKAWIWTVNHKNLEAWAKKTLAEKEKK